MLGVVLSTQRIQDNCPFIAAKTDYLNLSQRQYQTTSVRFLHEQLGGAFSVHDSPIWMDSSTRFTNLT